MFEYEFLGLAFKIIYIKTGKKSSAPVGKLSALLAFYTILETNLQQFIIEINLSLGVLYESILFKSININIFLYSIFIKSILNGGWINQ